MSVVTGSVQLEAGGYPKQIVGVDVFRRRLHLRNTTGLPVFLGGDEAGPFGFEMATSPDVIVTITDPGQIWALIPDALGPARFDIPGTYEYVVPPTSTLLGVAVSGAAGGKGAYDGTPSHWGIGGLGCLVSGLLPVTPGEPLGVIVGAKGGDGVVGVFGVSAGVAGAGGAPGGGDGISPPGSSTAAVGGGGGYSALLRGAAPLVIAGAGGGGGYAQPTNGDGGAGGLVGVDGGRGSGSATSGGKGGTATAGGAGGTGTAQPDGQPGTAAAGGDGGVPSPNNGGGGGGAGLYGGGGGEATNAGGGGGSSLAPAGMTAAAGQQPGNGLVVVTAVLRLVWLAEISKPWER